MRGPLLLLCLLHVSFSWKLTENENIQRAESCGSWRNVQSLDMSPWIVTISNGFTGESINGFLISDRHVISASDAILPYSLRNSESDEVIYPLRRVPECEDSTARISSTVHNNLLINNIPVVKAWYLGNCSSTYGMALFEVERPFGSDKKMPICTTNSDNTINPAMVVYSSVNGLMESLREYEDGVTEKVSCPDELSICTESEFLTRKDLGGALAVLNEKEQETALGVVWSYGNGVQKHVSVTGYSNKICDLSGVCPLEASEAPESPEYQPSESPVTYETQETPEYVESTPEAPEYQETSEEPLEASTISEEPSDPESTPEYPVMSSEFPEYGTEGPESEGTPESPEYGTTEFPEDSETREYPMEASTEESPESEGTPESQPSEFPPVQPEIYGTPEAEGPLETTEFPEYPETEGPEAPESPEMSSESPETPEYGTTRFPEYPEAQETQEPSESPEYPFEYGTTPEEPRESEYSPEASWETSESPAHPETYETEETPEYYESTPEAPEYGTTGSPEYPEVQEVLEYGTTESPDYPLTYETQETPEYVESTPEAPEYQETSEEPLEASTDHPEDNEVTSEDPEYPMETTGFPEYPHTDEAGTPEYIPWETSPESPDYPVEYATTPDEPQEAEGTPEASWETSESPEYPEAQETQEPSEYGTTGFPEYPEAQETPEVPEYGSTESPESPASNTDVMEYESSEYPESLEAFTFYPEEPRESESTPEVYPEYETTGFPEEPEAQETEETPEEPEYGTTESPEYPGTDAEPTADFPVDPEIYGTQETSEEPRESESTPEYPVMSSEFPEYGTEGPESEGTPESPEYGTTEFPEYSETRETPEYPIEASTEESPESEGSPESQPSEFPPVQPEVYGTPEVGRPLETTEFPEYPETDGPESPEVPDPTFGFPEAPEAPATSSESPEHPEASTTPPFPTGLGRLSREEDKLREKECGMWTQKDLQYFANNNRIPAIAKISYPTPGGPKEASGIFISDRHILTVADVVFPSGYRDVECVNGIIKSDRFDRVVLLEKYKNFSVVSAAYIGLCDNDEMKTYGMTIMEVEKDFVKPYSRRTPFCVTDKPTAFYNDTVVLYSLSHPMYRFNTFFMNPPKELLVHNCTGPSICVESGFMDDLDLGGALSKLVDGRREVAAGLVVRHGSEGGRQLKLSRFHKQICQLSGICPFTPRPKPTTRSSPKPEILENSGTPEVNSDEKLLSIGARIEALCKEWADYVKSKFF